MAKEARIEILKGKDSGSQFRITGDRVLFGRSNDVDVIVDDKVVSRHHAELVRIGTSFLIKDLNSSNGVFVNGQKILEHYLGNEDVFSIGNHMYRYIEVEAKITAQSTAICVKEGNTIPGISNSPLSANLEVPKMQTGVANKKRLIMYGALCLFVLFLVILMLSGDEGQKKPGQKDLTTTQDISPNSKDLELKDEDETKQTYVRQIADEDKEVFERANQFYFEGRREFRLKNYSRALDLFRKAMMLYHSHEKSNYYIKMTNIKIKEGSELELKLGLKMLEQKRYDDAIRHFDEAININARDPESKYIKEAEKWKKVVEKQRTKVFQ